MARRRPPPPELVDDADALPPELRRRIPTTPDEIDRWVGRDERAPADFGFPDWFWRTVEAATRKNAAARKWCEDRGHSYAMTFAGWARPSPQETAAGYVTTPPGGPIRHRRNRDE